MMKTEKKILQAEDPVCGKCAGEENAAIQRRILC